MKNELLTKEAILQEKFNSVTLRTENLKQFMLYSSMILHLGTMSLEISNEDEIRIMNLIGQAVSDSVELDENDEPISVLVANYMYLLTVYLKSMSNWNAWLELKDIKSIKDAQVLVRKVETWLLGQISLIEGKLTAMKPKIALLKLDNVTSYYNLLISNVNQLKYFATLRGKVNLKRLHQVGDIFPRYSLLPNFHSTDNYLESLKVTVERFDMEVSILLTVDAKTVFAKKHEESKNSAIKDQNEIAELDKQMRKKLKDLKDKYDADCTRYYEELHKPGGFKDTDLDELSLSIEYNEAKYEIEQEWNKKAKELEKKHDDATLAKLDLLMEDYSLLDFIKEFAIFAKATDETNPIPYPETSEERGIMLANLGIDESINLFIKLNHQKLTEDMILYLQDCIKKD